MWVCERNSSHLLLLEKKKKTHAQCEQRYTQAIHVLTKAFNDPRDVRIAETYYNMGLVQQERKDFEVGLFVALVAASTLMLWLCVCVCVFFLITVVVPTAHAVYIGCSRIVSTGTRLHPWHHYYQGLRCAGARIPCSWLHLR